MAIELQSDDAARDVAYLLSPQAIRDRCEQIYAVALTGATHFEVRPQRIQDVAHYVADITRERYPDLDIPLHSRWGHFQAGGIDRLSTLDRALAGQSDRDRARAKLDLVIVSVLLDAGAGSQWTYTERNHFGGTTRIARSEGLAVASLHMFMAGVFSTVPSQPLRVDAEALLGLGEEQLASGFQVDDNNALAGLAGRVELLRGLGRALTDNSTVFGGRGDARPGNILDHLTDGGRRQTISAPTILDAILRGLGNIWPGRLRLCGLPLGDTWPWPHELTGPLGATSCLVPFHKLSQWLCYSLIDVIEASPCRVTDIDALTGLAEYRNGGLFLDMGCLALRDPSLAERKFAPGDALIVEWRALTIALLDRLAPAVREQLGQQEHSFPLAKVLEGGTWHAGRAVAQARRVGGAPPLSIVSDGTVF